MAAGLSTATANAAADAIVASDAAWVQLHTGDPGADGTANVSSVTTREAQAWGSASGGETAATDTPTWTDWAGDDGEVVSWISHWSLSSSGTFGHSDELTNPVTMHTGDTLELVSDSVTLPTAS
jgi:hypothetical protein